MVNIDKQVSYWKENADEMNAFHIEGRYPETLTKPPTGEEAIRYMKRAEEVFWWLTNLL